MPVFNIYPQKPTRFGLGTAHGEIDAASGLNFGQTRDDGILDCGDGAKVTLKVGFLAFPIGTFIPAGSTINSAKLRMTPRTVTLSSHTMDLRVYGEYPASNDWSDAANQRIFPSPYCRVANRVNGVANNTATTVPQAAAHLFGSTQYVGCGLTVASDVLATSVGFGSIQRGTTSRPGDVWVTLHPATLAANGGLVVDFDTTLAESTRVTHDSLPNPAAARDFAIPATTLEAGEYYGLLVHSDYDLGATPTLSASIRIIGQTIATPTWSDNQILMGNDRARDLGAGVIGIGVRSGNASGWTTAFASSVTTLSATAVMTGAGTFVRWGLGELFNVDLAAAIQSFVDSAGYPAPLVLSLRKASPALTGLTFDDKDDADATAPRLEIDFDYPPIPLPPDPDPGVGGEGATPGETSIANAALVCLGEKRIDSLDEDTRTARILKDRFDEVRDSCLRSHPWNFAKQRVSLAADATPPVWGFARQFTLPHDCIRVLEVDDDDLGYPWEIHGRKIATSISDPLEVVYLRQVEDVREMDSLFRQYWALHLALDVCEAITGSSSKLRQVAAKIEAIEPQVRAANGQENQPPEIPRGLWERARGREDRSR